MNPKKIFLPLVLGAVLSTPARAGFVSDFVDYARENTNVTGAAALQGATLNAVTGGGFVYRAPRKEFVPFSVSPPSLKAGCGGIDLFLGAFSIPSRDEFVSFLRSVGTALPGLAFQLALQTMAPDLNEMVGRYSDLIRSYTNRFSDSCSAAQAILEGTGAAGHMQRLVESAKNSLRSSGEASDQSEADRKVRDNGEKAIEKTPEREDSGGNVIDAAELNLTWSLLSGGTFSGGDSEHLKEIMMTLVGTTIFRKEGSGEDAVISAEYIAGADLLPALFDEGALTSDALKIHCTESKKCLTYRYTPLGETSLVGAVREAAQHYLDAVSSRNAALVSDDELVMLASLSSVPLLKVLNLAAVSRYPALANELVRVFVEAASYEALAEALDALARDVRGSLSSAAGAQVSREHREHAERLQERVRSVQSELMTRKDAVVQQMTRAGALMTQLTHIERSLKHNEAVELQKILPAVRP